MGTMNYDKTVLNNLSPTIPLQAVVCTSKSAGLYQLTPKCQCHTDTSDTQVTHKQVKTKETHIVEVKADRIMWVKFFINLNGYLT